MSLLHICDCGCSMIYQDGYWLCPECFATDEDDD